MLEKYYSVLTAICGFSQTYFPNFNVHGYWFITLSYSSKCRFLGDFALDLGARCEIEKSQMA